MWFWNSRFFRERTHLFTGEGCLFFFKIISRAARAHFKTLPPLLLLEVKGERKLKDSSRGLASNFEKKVVYATKKSYFGKKILQLGKKHYNAFRCTNTGRDSMLTENPLNSQTLCANATAAIRRWKTDNPNYAQQFRSAKRIEALCRVILDSAGEDTSGYSIRVTPANGRGYVRQPVLSTLEFTEKCFAEPVCLPRLRLVAARHRVRFLKGLLSEAIEQKLVDVIQDINGKKTYQKSSLAEKLLAEKLLAEKAKQAASPPAAAAGGGNGSEPDPFEDSG